MKKFLMATAVVLSVYASSASALPDSAFFVGTLFGDSTLDIQSKTYDDTNLPTSTVFEAQDSQAFSFLVMGGMRFTDWVALEVQYMTSLQADKVYGAVRVNGGPTSQMDLSMAALGTYAVFQGGEDAYVKARVGFAKADAIFETDFANATFSSVDLSYGLSIGQKLGSLGSVELMYMRYPDIKVSRQKFAEDFGSTSPYTDRTTVRRDLTAELLAVGYVFQF
jgi:hypothetical protein